MDEARSRFDRHRDLMVALVDGTGIRGGIIAFGDPPPGAVRSRLAARAAAAFEELSPGQ